MGKNSKTGKRPVLKCEVEYIEELLDQESGDLAEEERREEEKEEEEEPERKFTTKGLLGLEGLSLLNKHLYFSKF